MRLAKYWNRLPREIVNAPSLQTYKARLDDDRLVLVYIHIHSFFGVYQSGVSQTCGDSCQFYSANAIYH